MSKITLLLPILLLSLTSAFADRWGSASVSRTGPNGGSVDASGQRYGRYSSGSVSATGPNGSTYNSSSQSFGRFGSRNVDAQGANGGSYSSSTQHAGGYTQRNVNATGPNGGSYSASGAGWSGYRSGYVYSGGSYHAATITVNRAYIAPVGVYAGWTVITQPYYITYPVYATYPVEVAVQVQLQRRGYYGGTIDGQIGPQTQAAIAKFQSQNGIAVTGTITQALLKTLQIS